MHQPRHALGLNANKVWTPSCWLDWTNLSRKIKSEINHGPEHPNSQSGPWWAPVAFELNHVERKGGPGM